MAGYFERSETFRAAHVFYGFFTFAINCYSFSFAHYPAILSYGHGP
jgi:hypothetical protein